MAAEPDPATAALGTFVFTARAGRDGVCVEYVSEGPVELLGSPAAGELLSAAMQRVAAPGQEDAIATLCEEMAAGRPGSLTLRLQGGEHRWARVRWLPRRAGDGTLMDGVVTDTTSTRAQERRFVALHSLVELSGDVIALADLDHRLVFLNACGRRFLGLHPDAELDDLRVRDLLAGEALRRFETEELAAIRAYGHWQGEATLTRPGTGETVPMQGSSYLIHDPLTGEPTAIAMVRRDVSHIRRVNDEQRAVTEIATAIAEGADQQPLLDAIAQRSLAATGARATAIVRASGTSRELVAQAGPAQAALAAADWGSEADPGTIRRSEIVVHGRRWGWLAAVGREPPGAEAVDDQAVTESLQRFAGLASTTVLTCQTRERLMRQATTDFVTGLSNHRALQQRLLEENSRAQRSGDDLAVVVMDIDGFKQINDEHGHAMGDEVLRDLGQVLRMEVREHDMAARLGGDEFVLLLPGATAISAYQVADRCRSSFAASGQARSLQTGISAGVADRSEDRTPDEMLRLADSALYWAKHNQAGVVIYDERVVRELSTQERAESLERSQVMGALRVLARVTDLKDASTHQHSHRVAALARCLADRAGWPLDRQALLHEAGLIHDVGKLVVADAILFKPERLSVSEFAEVKRHAALGAEIVAGALSDEQARWVREHHERPDGHGYPQGLREDEISDGAQLLAIADAWDVMTTGRSYQSRITPEAALAECRQLVGLQFTRWALGALELCLEHSDAPFAQP